MTQNPILTICQKFYFSGIRVDIPNFTERDLNRSTLSTEDYNKLLSARLSSQWYEEKGDTDIEKHLCFDVDEQFALLKEKATDVFNQMDQHYRIRELTPATLCDFVDQDLEGRSGLLVSLFPKDIYGTKYRRCNSKVFEFINSIDLPDSDLVDVYSRDLSSRAEKSPNGLYSEMYLLSTSKGKGILRVVINGSGTLFISYLHEREIDGALGIDFSFKKAVERKLSEAECLKPLDQALEELYTNDDMIERSKKFGFSNPLAFLVNLYLAEKTGSAVRGEEPKEEKRDVERLASRGPKDKKPKDVCYEYVKVTDEAWKQYEESERIRREGGPRVGYTHRKSFWWTKPYYRKQNYKNNTSKIILINGHYCHARTKVQELPIVEVLV